MLEEEGYYVYFRTGNFLREAEEEGLKYNQLYTISRRHINDTFAEHGGFDLVIDLHRDSAPRSVFHSGERRGYLCEDDVCRRHEIFQCRSRDGAFPAINRQNQPGDARYNEISFPAAVGLQPGYGGEHGAAGIGNGPKQHGRKVRHSLRILVEALTNGGIE